MTKRSLEALKSTYLNNAAQEQEDEYYGVFFDNKFSMVDIGKMYARHKGIQVTDYEDRNGCKEWMYAVLGTIYALGDIELASVQYMRIHDHKGGLTVQIDNDYDINDEYGNYMIFKILNNIQTIWDEIDPNQITLLLGNGVCWETSGTINTAYKSELPNSWYRK